MFNSQGSQVSSSANYIEDVFSTYLYAGNSPSTNTIVNNIDLSTYGGLVWCKERNAGSNSAWDTARGVKNLLIPNQTAANLNIPVTYPAYPDYGLQSFNSNGFTLGKNWEGENAGSSNIVSWTFRKQPKFFDVVTFTTTNSTNARIPHNLGSVPGFYVIKRVDGAGAWFAYHGSLGRSSWLQLQSTNAVASNPNCWGTTDPTSTDFGIDEQYFTNGTVGLSYVAYVFASNAGGFGLTGTDNVISCGSYTTDGSNKATVNLGYEPQWLLIKRTDSAGAWYLMDTTRSWAMTAGSSLNPNSTAAEADGFPASYIIPTATGFQDLGAYGANVPFIYVAIRRGPMKVPTLGTSVFSPYAATTPGQAVVTTGFPVDLQMQKNAGAATDMRFVDRLRGVSSTPTSPSAAFPFLVPSSTAAESTGTGTTLNWNNTGFTVGSTYESSAKAWAVNFRRAPSFFDEVCYTGTGAVQNVTHNLTVVPEMMIVKSRTDTRIWTVYLATLGNNNYLQLSTTDGFNNTSTAWNETSPTASQFTVGTYLSASAQRFVAYLFASCAGVSKVGSYVGNGSSQTINCGFTGGARFVLVKASSLAGAAQTGDWMVADSARGIVAGNDPYLELNNTNAEVTGEDWLDTDNTGFIINEVSASNANTNGVTYIFLAIA